MIFVDGKVDEGRGKGRALGFRSSRRQYRF